MNRAPNSIKHEAARLLGVKPADVLMDHPTWKGKPWKGGHRITVKGHNTANSSIWFVNHPGYAQGHGKSFLAALADLATQIERERVRHD